MPFQDAERSLLDEPAFAKLTTLMEDGAPQTTVMWYRRVDDTLTMIAPAHVLKVRNIARDSRVAVVIDDPSNGYHYLQIRGKADVVRDDAAARAELRQVATRYVGDRADAYVDGLSDDPRVLIVIHPERVRLHAGTPPGERIPASD
jgi:PPOX class probable F420-dependent enzyme